MPISFYPFADDIDTGTMEEKLDLLMEAALQYKGAVLDTKPSPPALTDDGKIKRTTPRDIKIAFNWQEMAKILREVRELSEANALHKQKKSECLLKLAEIYEILRAAKMPKLEAVRALLINEANHLKETK